MHESDARYDTIQERQRGSFHTALLQSQVQGHTMCMISPPCTQTPRAWCAYSILKVTQQHTPLLRHRGRTDAAEPAERWQNAGIYRLIQSFTSRALKIGGRSLSNCTSTTAPITWVTRPTDPTCTAALAWKLERAVHAQEHK